MTYEPLILQFPVCHICKQKVIFTPKWNPTADIKEKEEYFINKSQENYEKHLKEQHEETKKLGVNRA